MKRFHDAAIPVTQDATLLMAKMARWKRGLCFGEGKCVFMLALHNQHEESREPQDPTRLGRVLGNDQARISAIPIPHPLRYVK